MTKEMIVSSNGHETVVAILEDDLVAEVFVERERSRGVVGNVYKGRVSKVLPGMQSSFIDLGLERDGFLYVAEVIDTLEEFERLAADDDDEAKTESAGPENGAEIAKPVGRDASGQPRTGDHRSRDREPRPQPMRHIQGDMRSFLRADSSQPEQETFRFRRRTEAGFDTVRDHRQ